MSLMYDDGIEQAELRLAELDEFPHLRRLISINASLQLQCLKLLQETLSE